MLAAHMVHKWLYSNNFRKFTFRKWPSLRNVKTSNDHLTKTDKSRNSSHFQVSPPLKSRKNTVIQKSDNFIISFIF